MAELSSLTAASLHYVLYDRLTIFLKNIRRSMAGKPLESTVEQANATESSVPPPYGCTHRRRSPRTAQHPPEPLVHTVGRHRKTSRTRRRV